MRVLFVCSGNICRSPIAEACAAVIDGVEARSAGTWATSGSPATAGAARAAAELDLSLTDHRSQPLSRALVDWADLIFGMEQEHLAAVEALGGNAEFLDPAGVEIDDPYMQPDEVYRRVATQIDAAIGSRSGEWV